MDPKPPVLWIRGTADLIVSDTSLYDLAHLGALGAVPGWPGPDRYPAQPMIAQTRAVLDAYAAGGGRYRELALEGSGHGPHLDRPAEFRVACSLTSPRRTPAGPPDRRVPARPAVRL